jgi:uncharacterized protein YegP (UPF0339 family)
MRMARGPLPPTAFIVYRDRTGMWRWALIMSTGRRLADSAGSFPTKKEARADIEFARDTADAPIMEHE